MLFTALPHLVKLVHGNICSIQKLIKEFREYWSRHTAADGDISMTDKADDLSVREKDGDMSVVEKDGDVSVTEKDGDMCVTEKDNNVSVADCSIADMSVTDADGDVSMIDTDADTSVVDKDGDTSMIDKDGDRDGDVTKEIVTTDACHIGSPGGVDSSLNTVCRYTFSKRQLDKTIRKVSMYERRPEYKRCCWYVHQHLLEKYSLTDLPIPTQWQWLTRSNVDLRKKKVVAPNDRSSSTPVRNSTPTIKRFAVPNMKPIVNPIRKRPQLAATITSPGSCKSPILIDDACSSLATVTPSIGEIAAAPSGEKVVSGTLAVPHELTAVITRLPKVSTPGGHAATPVYEDSDNSLVLHFSESESGTTDGHSDNVADQVAFPKFPMPPSSRKSSWNETGSKGKDRSKPRRVMPTLITMFGNQTKLVGVTNSTPEKPAISKLAGSDSTPIEID